MSDWINTILQGLLTGGLYALFAAGLSLSFGVMRIINIAHGDFAILAAYAAIALAAVFGLNPVEAMCIVVPAMALLGYALQRGILNLTLGDDVLRPLLVTFGFSIVIQNLLLKGFSADSRSLDSGAFGTASLQLGGNLAVGLLPLTVMAAAVAILAFMQWLFSYTLVGRAFRAAADDPETVQLMGVNNRHIYALAMAIAMAIVAVAGVFLALQTTVSPTDGPEHLLYAFEAVIIGGLGSLWGTLVRRRRTGRFTGDWRKTKSRLGILAGHLCFLAVLIIRPSGLFPTGAEPMSTRRATGASVARRGGGVFVPRRRRRHALVGGTLERKLADRISVHAGAGARLEPAGWLWRPAIGWASRRLLAIGGYMLVMLGVGWGLNPFLVIPLAGGVAMLAAVPMGAVLFRLRGANFAVGTWVCGGGAAAVDRQ